MSIIIIAIEHPDSNNVVNYFFSIFGLQYIIHQGLLPLNPESYPSNALIPKCVLNWLYAKEDYENTGCT